MCWRAGCVELRREGGLFFKEGRDGGAGFYLEIAETDADETKKLGGAAFDAVAEG